MTVCQRVGCCLSTHVYIFVFATWRDWLYLTKNRGPCAFPFRSQNGGEAASWAKLRCKVGIRKSIDLKTERQDNLTAILIHYIEHVGHIQTTSAYTDRCGICTETFVVTPS